MIHLFNLANSSLELSQSSPGIEAMVGSTTGDDSLTYRQWLPQHETTIVFFRKKSAEIILQYTYYCSFVNNSWPFVFFNTPKKTIPIHDKYQRKR